MSWFADAGERSELASSSVVCAELVSKYGVVSAVSGSRPRSALRDLDSVLADIGSGTPNVSRLMSTICSGRAWRNAGLARLIAVVEAAERYSTGATVAEPTRPASAVELGNSALDYRTFPACSAGEYSAPDCNVVKFDPHAKIRWTLGTRLQTHEPVWVPTIMANYLLQDLEPAERFCNLLSSGWAAHPTLEQAILSGLLELIERDAIAIAWLQQLCLPQIHDTDITELSRTIIRRAHEQFVETFLLNATTDLRVPTVWCVQRARYDDRARVITSAAAAPTIALAAEKALLEISCVRGVFYSSKSPDYATFRDITDGARYMADQTREHAFNFLFKPRGSDPVANSEDLPSDPSQAIEILSRRLQCKGIEVAVVNRTCRELRAANLHAVCVVAPGLQPLSLRPQARYLAHPRLYSAPLEMGYRVLSCEELNPWPHPFA